MPSNLRAADYRWRVHWPTGLTRLDIGSSVGGLRSLCFFFSILFSFLSLPVAVLSFPNLFLFFFLSLSPFSTPFSFTPTDLYVHTCYCWLDLPRGFSVLRCGRSPGEQDRHEAAPRRRPLMQEQFPR
ncbi:hypothetical protein MAPG_03394 [Magnaporthiopsis poae ATCC 64411]|uniref:Transmembrane protein n=1 Tax=Magnaporthiopsis poae (strain ATCC 64411 / 73-15) TaxID=644358 RepID=A0A0C4DTW7_MAGP6|nr:hypothetical protein MAPG_03394 [Magnaporthiopsis poae ATCC 64411]